MSRRGKVALGLGLSAFLIAALILYFLWPARTPHRSAFEAVALNMTEAEVEVLVRDLPGETSPAGLRRSRSVDWEGFFRSVPHRVRLVAGRDGSMPSDPVMIDSVLMGSTSHLELKHPQPGTTTFTDRETGQVVARARAWSTERDRLVVVFGPDGRVIERAYVTFGGWSPFRW